ncbi:hypothetical protein B0H13DRAFT_1645393 [Mycena leptocephala]|nr:hypothetical protein B0H13DRAFT_1645393 [Mycena leptocephala]
MEPPPKRPSRANTVTLDAELLDSVSFSADLSIVHSLHSSKLVKRRNRGAQINISNPLNPVHLTHIHFNSSTQELGGLPSYYCQLLKESGYVPSRPLRCHCSVMQRCVHC